MRTIIAGSRTITDPYILIDAIDSCGWEITKVLCGMAKGVDELGRQWALDCDISVYYYPPVWRVGEAYDKFAGFKRNIEMAKNADALLAVWDGISKGTGHMIDTARKYKLKTYVHLV